MPSSLHDRLVETSLARAVAMCGGAVSGVWSDLSDVHGASRSFRIGEHVPDYAIDLVDGGVCIGEAKTGSDIDRAHTYSQVQAYYDFIRIRGNGQVRLIVPLGFAGTALSFCRSMARRVSKAPNVEVYVEEWQLLTAPICRDWRAI